MLKNMHISLYEIIVRGRIKTLIYLQNVRKARSQTRETGTKLILSLLMHVILSLLTLG